MCHDSREENKIYDAYISYSRKDEQFVFQEIVSKLEGNPYRYSSHQTCLLSDMLILSEVMRNFKRGV
jgi:hypothetical protein